MAIYKLKDICLKIGSGATPRGGKEAYCDEGISLIRSQNVLDFTFSYDGLVHINDQQAEKLSNVEVKSQDILLNITGDSVARVCAVDPRVLPARVNQHVAIIRPDENRVLSSYILFFLQMIKPYLLQIAAGGATRNALTKNMIENLELEVPDILSQKKIVSVLDDIQEKIRDNNEINKNLAEQSQAIFAEFMCKYPCVLSPLGDMAEIIDCLHSKKPEAVNDTAYQLLQLNNITDSGFLDLSSKYYISKSDYENWTRKCEIVEGDCVITNVGRIGAVSQAPNGTHAAMGRNMTCIRLRKDNPFYSYLITALLSPHIRREIMKNTDEGTIMGALNVKNIPLLLFPMFAPPTMNALEDLLSPIRKAIEQNYLSNQTLSLLRDFLLPRLMSGELDVSDIDL